MLKGKSVLITGGTGSLGHALVRHIFQNHKPKKVIVYSRDEFKQSEMAKESPDPLYNNLRFLLGDVRDKTRLTRALQGVDICIHAAALKQVPALEYNPEEAIKTNVIGSMNVVNACIDAGVKKALLISTDKAVNPINLYGSTKLCAEKLFMAANAYAKTSFSCVRYGNVIGSRGSVIPLFQEIVRQAKLFGSTPEFPITDKEMTRFWITLDEAVDLVMLVLESDRNKIFVPRIPSMKIIDLAKAICTEAKIKEVGVRSGEKLHESLISEDNADVVLVENGKICDLEPDARLTSNENTLWFMEQDLRERI